MRVCTVFFLVYCSMFVQAIRPLIQRCDMFLSWNVLAGNL